MRSLFFAISGILLLSFLSCKHTPKPVKSVVILGNSIVEHGEAPSIGWKGHWGMAASARDSDFVHRLIYDVHQYDTAVNFRVGTMAGFENIWVDFDFKRVDTFKNADMIILRFSENVEDSFAFNHTFIDRYDKLIKYIDPDDEAVKVVVSGFWKRPKTNHQLEEYAQKSHYIFVRNDDLLADSTNAAWGLFAVPGVASHPSNKGMRMISERIWEKIEVYFKPPVKMH
jgi:hypothetical protein